MRWAMVPVLIVCLSACASRDTAAEAWAVGPPQSLGEALEDEARRDPVRLALAIGQVLGLVAQIALLALAR